MALTEDLALYALGVAAQESHPSRADSRCLNRTQFKMTCDCCTEACPANIELHGARIDWGACTDCNLCVTACPTGALAESGSLARTLEAAAGAAPGAGTPAAPAPGADSPVPGATTPSACATVVACTRHKGVSDVRLSCIASLSWEYAALLALRGTLVLKTAACRECPDAECAQRVRGLISRLREFFGPDEFARRVMPKLPIQSSGTPQSPAVKADAARRSAGSARRVALESAGGVAKSAAERLTAQDNQDGRGRTDRRWMLLTAIDAIPASQRPRLHWKSLTVDTDCRGCTVCERLCPNEAIRIELDRDGGESFFIHDAGRCTQCGLCYMSCPEEAISDWEAFTCIDMPAIRTTPIDVEFCEKCGKPFKPKDGALRCPACSRFRFA